ncbi:hypothetical protein PGB90_005569 [Kerria lacca]
MSEERSPKWAAKYTPSGKRDRGRPRRRLEDMYASSETDGSLKEETVLLFLIFYNYLSKKKKLIFLKSDGKW